MDVSWTKKKAERQIIDAFELWCWIRLLRVPWTARRSNQSILKEISPEYSLEGLMLNLKLQSFGHLMRRTDSLEKTLMLGKIEVRRRRGWQMMKLLNGIINSMEMSLNKLWEIVNDRGSLACSRPWGPKELDTGEWLNNKNRGININRKWTQKMGRGGNGDLIIYKNGASVWADEKCWR